MRAPRLTFASASVALLLAAPAARAAETPCGADASLLGTSDALDKTSFGGYPVGGLSALAADGTGRALALVDNDGSSPARVYGLRLGPTASGGIDAAATSVTRLGTFTGDDFDGEGVALEPDGSLLVSSETEPSIRHFSRSGALLDALDVPERFRVAPAGEATGNATLEGLSSSPSGRHLLAAMEGALSSDPPTSDGRPRLRLLEYDRGSDGTYGRPRQLSYDAEPGQGISDVLMLDDTTALVLERSLKVDLGFAVRLFTADLSQATDVTDVPSLDTPGVVAAPKRLLLDLRACALAKLDNVEGMTFGPKLADGRMRVYLVSDDNFSAMQHTRLYDVALGRPAPAAPPATTPSTTTTSPPTTTTPAPPQPATTVSVPATTTTTPGTSVTAAPTLPSPAPIVVFPPSGTAPPALDASTPLTVSPASGTRRLRDALRRGLVVRPGCSEVCSVTVKLTLGARQAKALGVLSRRSRAASATVATATASRCAPGGMVLARFTARARRRLADRRGLFLDASVRASARGSVATERSTVALRR